MVRLCASLAHILCAMHKRGYSHRDVKPENVLWLEDKGWCLCDFGLVHNANNSRLTQDGKKLGPMYYIAPEMLNEAGRANGEKADVYSLAKFLWRQASGQKYPIPGSHRSNEDAFTISAWVAHSRAFYLDRLLEQATQHSPDKRLAMNEFARELSDWLTPPQEGYPINHTWSKSRAVSAQRFYHDVHSLDNLGTRVEEERKRIFNAFDSVVSEIRVALEKGGFINVEINMPSGGNAIFYQNISHNHTAGCGNDTTWFYQYDVRVACRDDRLNKPKNKWDCTTLMGGINLGFPALNDDLSSIADISAPVLAAAGYVLSVTTSEFGNRDEERVIGKWGEIGKFHIGYPSEAAVIPQLIAALRECMDTAVNALFNYIETKR